MSSARDQDGARTAARDLNGREALPEVIWEGKLFGRVRVYVLSSGERVVDAQDLEAFLETSDLEAIELADELTASPWPKDLYRHEGETEDAYQERVRPLLVSIPGGRPASSGTVDGGIHEGPPLTDEEYEAIVARHVAAGRPVPPREAAFGVRDGGFVVAWATAESHSPQSGPEGQGGSR